MPKKKPFSREITLVVGQTGMGKTQWAKRYIREHKRVIISDPMSEYEGAGVMMFDDLSALIAHVEKFNTFRVAYSDLRDFDTLALIAKSIPETLFVVEESQRIIPPLSKIPTHFEDLIYRGRHSGTSILLVAQRPSTVNIAVRSQYHRLITFRQSENRDLAWISEIAGENLSDDIRALEVFEFYEVNPKGVEKNRLTKIIK